VVDCYVQRVSIQTDSNNFRTNLKDSPGHRLVNRTMRTILKKESLHRCSLAAQQVTHLTHHSAIRQSIMSYRSLTHQTHSTRLTASKQAAKRRNTRMLAVPNRRAKCKGRELYQCHQINAAELDWTPKHIKSNTSISFRTFQIPLHLYYGDSSSHLDL